jgi:hypothetical protein
VTGQPVPLCPNNPVESVTWNDVQNFIAKGKSANEVGDIIAAYQSAAKLKNKEDEKMKPEQKPKINKWLIGFGIVALIIIFYCSLELLRFLQTRAGSENFTPTGMGERKVTRKRGGGEARQGRTAPAMFRPGLG